jgi:xanthosine utilization system XapX-like protein
MEHFEALVGVLSAYLGESILPNMVELMGIFGRVCFIKKMYIPPKY